jgi:hypothetical protein
VRTHSSRPEGANACSPKRKFFTATHACMPCRQFYTRAQLHTTLTTPPNYRNFDSSCICSNARNAALNLTVAHGWVLGREGGWGEGPTPGGMPRPRLARSAGGARELEEGTIGRTINGMIDGEGWRAAP